MNTFDRPTSSEGLDECAHASVGGYGQPFDQRVVWQGFMRPLRHALALGFIRTGERARMSATLLKRSPGLEESFLEVAPNGHHFTGRFH